MHCMLQLCTSVHISKVLAGVACDTTFIKWPHLCTWVLRGHLFLQVIEFESSPLLMVGHALGLRVSLIAYPVISIKKASHFLSSGFAVCLRRQPYCNCPMCFLADLIHSHAVGLLGGMSSRQNCNYEAHAGFSGAYTPGARDQSRLQGTAVRQIAPSQRWHAEAIEDYDLPQLLWGPPSSMSRKPCAIALQSQSQYQAIALYMRWKQPPFACVCGTASVHLAAFFSVLSSDKPDRC